MNHSLLFPSSSFKHSKHFILVSLILLFFVTMNAHAITEIIDYPMTINYSDTNWAEGVYIGYSGTGSVIHNAGTVSTTNMMIGYLPGSSGSYDLSGTGNLAVEEFCVGFGGQAVFNQTGGTHTASQISVFGLSGNDNGQIVTGGNGLYQLSGGYFSTPRLLLAYSDGCTGSFLMTGGVLEATGGNPLFGRNISFYEGQGIFTMTGGEATFTNIDVTDRTIFDFVDGGMITLEYRLRFDGGTIDLGKTGVFRIKDTNAEKIDLVKSWIGTNLTADGQIDVTWEGGYTIATAVPEPATVSLLALGGVVLLRKRK